MRRFFLNEPLTDSLEIKGDDAQHIMRVLRMKVGDNIIIVGQGGFAGIAEIQVCNPDRVGVVLKEVIQENKEPPIRVVLVQALPKGDKMDYIVQKAVEMGVSQIIPMVSEHCVVKYDERKKEERCQRWQKIAVEAAKQCGRILIPEIKPVQKFMDIVKDHEPSMLTMMLYEGRMTEPIKDLFVKHKDCRRCVLLIGPEGGVSKSEVALCRSHNIASVSLGPRILRTETASLAALAVIMYEFGDMGG